MKHSFRNHLALTPSETTRLLAWLDESPATQRVDRRRDRRREYRVPEIAFTLTHPGGGVSRFLVHARNLSAGGMGFLHGGYMHPGSKCNLALLRLDGSALTVGGTVVRCRHLEGTCHEIGVRFEQEVDPLQVVAPDSTDTALRSEATELPSLHGRILLADDADADRRLLTHQLSATGLVIKGVGTSGSALDALRRGQYDLILCALEVASGDAAYLVKHVRGMGIREPLIVLSAETDPKALASVAIAGASEIVGKPCDAGYLMLVVGEWLGQPPTDTPVRSRYEGEPGISDILVSFIDDARQSAARLDAALREGASGPVREMLLRIAGSGQIHGFDQLSTAARDAHRVFERGGDLDGARTLIERVLAIVSRVRCSGTAKRFAPVPPRPIAAREAAPRDSAPESLLLPARKARGR